MIGKMVRAFATGDLSDIDSYVDQRYVDHQGLRETKITGHEGFRQVVAAARNSYSDLKVTIEDSIVEGSKIAARLRWIDKGTPDGVTFARETIDILRIENGRAVEHWGARLWVDLE